MFTASHPVPGLQEPGQDAEDRSPGPNAVDAGYPFTAEAGSPKEGWARHSVECSLRESREKGGRILRSELAGSCGRLVPLDLNMPRKDAREALLATRSEPSLKDIPIVILTTSEEEWDIASTKKAGAESFIIKPATFKVWVEIVRSSGGMHSG